MIPHVQSRNHLFNRDLHEHFDHQLKEYLKLFRYSLFYKLQFLEGIQGLLFQVQQVHLFDSKK